MSERPPDSRPVEITPVVRPVRGWIRPPGSKSLTNRALIVAALAEGTSRLTGVLDSQDTRVMVESLRRLGLSLEQDVDARTLTITVAAVGRRFPGRSCSWRTAEPAFAS